MKTWHHFHFGLLHMQCVPSGPRVDAPSYALEHATMEQSGKQPTLLVVPTELLLLAFLQNRRGRDPRLLQSGHCAFALPPTEVLGECPCSARWLRVMADLAARRVGHQKTSGFSA